MAWGEKGARSRSDIAALLAAGDFRRLWGCGALLNVVRWVENLAAGIFVIDLTGSAAAVAVVGFMRMLPMLLLGAVAGALTSRFRRRTLLLAGVGTAGLFALVLSLLASVGAIAVWQIALGSFLTGILWTSDFPIRRTLMADIAGQERISAAMALDAATTHITRLLGAGLGGLLVGAVGLEGAYLLGATVYALVVVLLWGIRRDEVTASGFHRNLLADTVGGLRVVAAERFLLMVMAVTIVFNFFGFSYTAMVPVIGRTTLHADAFAIGLLASTEAAASLIVTLTFAALAPRRGLGALYAFSALTFMGGVLIFALSSSYWLSLAVMVMTGAAWGGFSVTQSTLMLLVSPPAVRARAMGALAICIGIAPLGMLHLGWLAEHLGAPLAVALSAAVGAVAVIAVMALFPRLIKPDLPRVEGGGANVGERLI
jgi:MFS family permease